MITKTYLDGKLRSLEERLERRIDVKDHRVFREIEIDIANLKNGIKSMEEKFDENRDIIRNYIVEQNNMKEELKELKLRIGNIEKKINLESSKNGNDEIASDF